MTHGSRQSLDRRLHLQVFQIHVLTLTFSELKPPLKSKYMLRFSKCKNKFEIDVVHIHRNLYWKSKYITT